MTDSYHYQIEPEPRVENVWFDGYFLIGAEQSQLYFPSGAALQLAGDKIVGRVEAEAEPVTLGAILRRALEKLGAPAPVAEPIRPALDWNTAKPFDTFGPEFTVTKGEVPTAPLHTSPTTDSAYPAIAGLLRG